MEIRNHGTTLPNGIRAPHNILGVSPQLTVEQARAAVEFLRADKSKADGKLKTAVAANNGQADLNALSSMARKLATELAKAEVELEKAEAYAAAAAREQQRKRFSEIGGELRKAREQVAEHYREASLALGRWYLLCAEARALATTLADRLGNCGVYYNADLKTALAEPELDPNPFPALKDAGYGALMVAFRTQIPLFPLKKNEGGQK